VRIQVSCSVRQNINNLVIRTL